MARKVKNKKGKVRSRLTRMGWVFLIITMVVGVAAVKTQTSLVYLFFGAMVGALVVSSVMARQMVAGIELRRDVSGRAWQNQTVHLGYYLRNTRWQGSCLGITVSEVAPAGIQGASGYCVHLPPRQVFRSGARFVSRRRGRILLRKNRVRSSFPFGLVEAYRFFDQENSIVVWPARGMLKRQLLNRGAVETSTAAPSLVSGGQDEFFGLREYRVDDNPRWIHWRKSAGRTVPIVREMSHPLPEILYIVLDTYCSDASQVAIVGREKLLRFAATVIDHAFTKGYQVGLALAYDRQVLVLHAQSGQGPRCRLLDALADVDLNQRRTIDDVVSGMNRRLLSKAQVLVLTQKVSQLDHGAIESLRAASRHIDVLHLDRLEKFFDDDPLAGGVS